MQEQPRIVDLFCGCGGFSLGAHNADLAASVAIDVDPILTSSFKVNFPKTKFLSADISKLSGSAIELEAGGRVDGVFGGPPCQAFSSIGRRLSDDPRRSLVSQFFRVVAELQPTFFVMENVPGLGYATSRPLLDHGLGLLGGRYELLGPMTLDAADFGAATKRRRLFVIGYDARYCDPIVKTDLESLYMEPASVRSAIGDLMAATRLRDTDGFDQWKIKKRGRPSQYASTMRSSDGTFTGHRSTIHTDEVKKRFKAVKEGEIDEVGRHPKLAWSGQCPTLRAGTGSDRGSYQSVRPIHPEKPRVITAREAARIQGFPDWFKFHPTIWHSFRMIGNSVSPIISKAIFSLIADRIELSATHRMAAE